MYLLWRSDAPSGNDVTKYSVPDFIRKLLLPGFFRLQLIACTHDLPNVRRQREKPVVGGRGDTPGLEKELT